MAERVGFEPTVELPLHTLSKRAHSTALTSLRRCPGLGEYRGMSGLGGSLPRGVGADAAAKWRRRTRLIGFGPGDRLGILRSTTGSSGTAVGQCGDGSQRGPDPVQSQPVNRVRAGRQQR